MDNYYIKVSINNHTAFIETTEPFINTLVYHFIDHHYKVEKLEKEEYYEALRDGEPVYHANSAEIVDEFIETNEKLKYIKNGGKEN